jgi:hypothetical protein
MSHDEAFAELEAAALDSLSSAERRSVLAHAADCPVCAPALAELRGTVGLLGWGAPAAPLEAERAAALRARLVARAAGGRESATSTAPAPEPARVEDAAVRGAPGSATARAHGRWRGEWAGWLAAAGIALAAAAGMLRARDERDTLRASLSEARRAGAADAAALRASVAERDRLLARLTGPGVRVVELSAGGAKPAVARLASARMFWDRASGSWTMFVHDLTPPPAGRTYQLWLVTPQAKIPAGTFTPSATGDALVRATYALDPHALKAIAVTEEPAGGVPQPTGRVVIAGAAE